LNTPGTWIGPADQAARNRPPAERSTKITPVASRGEPAVEIAGVCFVVAGAGGSPSSIVVRFDAAGAYGRASIFHNANEAGQHFFPNLYRHDSISYMYEVFEHTADLGLRVHAADLGALFADAGRGLFAMIVENLEEVRPDRELRFHIQGRDLEYLLFDWLNELLFIFDKNHLLLSACEVTVGAEGLEATARGEPLDRTRHRLDHEVKAITYHGLKVQRTNDGWLAEVIVDI
jgi:SHS2 domain-containing protein